MIPQLILKDLQAYKVLILLRILLTMAIVSSLFHLQFYPANVYIVQACMVFAAASSIFSFSEKSRNTEILTCSLPVSRVSIVVARYLTSALIMVLGILLFYFMAYLATFLLENAANKFSNIANLRVLYLTIFFVTVHTSLFLPAVFWFRMLGSIIGFAVALIASVVLTRIIFRPYKLSMVAIFREDNVELLVLLTILTILILFASIVLSVKLYQKRNL